MPEALGNLRRLLPALRDPREPTTVLVATGARPDPRDLAPLLEAEGFLPAPADLDGARGWERGHLQLLVGAGRFAAWASWAELGLATAGTATEQLVGLGVPALSLPGPGPQFKAGFARRQSRLLGGAVQPCRNEEELAARLGQLLADESERRRLGGIGRRRMGPSGGSDRLAALIEERLLRLPA
jgi:uncharacterized protein (TIGR03492 family)